MVSFASLLFGLHALLSVTATASVSVVSGAGQNVADEHSEGATTSSTADDGAGPRDAVRVPPLARNLGRMAGRYPLNHATHHAPSTKLLSAEVRMRNSEASMTIEDQVDSDDDSDEIMEDTDDPRWMAKNASSGGFLDISISRRPVEGSIKYEPEVWNTDKKIQASHNCFMYALNDVNDDVRQACARAQAKAQPKRGRIYERVCRKYFHKPGYYFQYHLLGFSQIDQWTRPFTTCNFMMPLLFSDNPSSSIWANSQTGKQLSEYDNCPKKEYMAALVVDPKKGFHFYRRDHACADPKNKGKLCWSHKPGITKATNKDASGAEIPSLEHADRAYGTLNYKQLCGVFCVPYNGIGDTHSGNKWFN